MENKPVILPHWLEVLECCGVKTQLAVIKALVKYQAEGVMPDFKGTKLALFNFLVRDLSPAQEEKGADGKNKPDNALTRVEKTRLNSLMLTIAGIPGLISELTAASGLSPAEYMSRLKDAVLVDPPARIMSFDLQTFVSYIRDKGGSLARG